MITLNLVKTDKKVDGNTITINFTESLKAAGNQAINVIGNSKTLNFVPVLSADVYHKGGSLKQRTYVSGLYRLVVLA